MEKTLSEDTIKQINSEISGFNKLTDDLERFNKTIKETINIFDQNLNTVKTMLVFILVIFSFIYVTK
jgi:hypothetical protein